MAKNPYDDLNKEEEVIETTATEEKETVETDVEVEKATTTETVVKDETSNEPTEDDLADAILGEDRPVEETPAELLDELGKTNEVDASSEEIEEERKVDVSDTNVVILPNEILNSFKEEKVINENNKDVALYLVRGTQKSVYAKLTQVDSDKMKDIPEEDLLKWWRAVNTANSVYMVQNDQLFDATTREGATWSNMVNKAPDKPMTKLNFFGPISDRKGTNPRDKSDTKALAHTVISGILKLGLPTYIPLYHSGFWVKLRVPTAAAFVRLDEAIANDKIEYGMRTKGKVFGNDSVILRRHIAEFIIEHIDYSNTPFNNDPDELRKYIKVTDLPELMRGMMQARYPDGYPMVNVCTANPEKCQHVEEGTVDLRSLSWVDTSKLTPKQVAILSLARREVTLEQIQDYQNEFEKVGDKIYLSQEEPNELGEIENGAVITLEFPSLDRDQDYGEAWVRAMDSEIEDIMREENDSKVRETKFNELVTTNRFKEYGQWVSKIDIYSNGEIERTITDTDELDELFELFSGSGGWYEKFINQINTFKNKNIVHLVGTVNKPCPKCGGKLDTNEGNFHIILPIDMQATFFTLIRAVVKEVLRRINM